MEAITIKSESEHKRYDTPTKVTVIKTYGIKRTCNGKYTIAYDVSEDKKYAFTITSGRSFTTPEVAQRKALEFMQGVHKDFLNFLNEDLHFEFKYMGLID